MDGKRCSASILIADDEPNICLALKFLLEDHGCDVRCAMDGEEAIQEIQRSPPDLLLLDLAMPKRSGFEVCQTARSDPKLTSMRILVMSAQCQDVAVEKALAMGADGFLAKPFSNAQVVEAITSLIDQGQLNYA